MTGIRESIAYYERDGRRVPGHILDPSKPKARAVNRRTSTGWPAWCVPTSMFTEFIGQKDVRQQLEADYTALPKIHNPLAKVDTIVDSPNPWRELLCARMSTILGISETAVTRRLYDVTSGKTHVVKAEFAEAAAIAVGRLLDHGTNIPVLPGSIESSRELIRVRSEMVGDKLDEVSVRRLGQRTQRIAWLIVAYPHNLERLQDLAPYDCLRPPYR